MPENHVICPKCRNRFNLTNPNVDLVLVFDGSGAFCPFPRCGGFVEVETEAIHTAHVARGEANDDEPASFD